ncbi:glycosyltransferase family 2 protein [candidate division KSB1 bacterium]
MVQLSIIIVSYNAKDYLEKALLTVQFAVSGFSSEIFVVDNASDDGSPDMIKEKFPDVILIENNVNTGFARANNAALKRSEGKFILLLNPDTIVKENTFKIVFKAFEEYPEAGAAGCKILNEDGSLQLSCRRSIPTPWITFTRMLGLSRIFPQSRIFAKYNLTYLDADEVAEVEALSGAFIMVRREVLDKTGYLDEQFFMYGEDLDWCYRISQAGYKIIYYPKTSITHYKGRSTDMKTWAQVKVFYEAMSKFSAKHFRNYSVLLPLWLMKSAIWSLAILNYIFRKIFR